jgi:DNA polymerase III subunit alpha, Gram-positive type
METDLLITLLLQGVLIFIVASLNSRWCSSRSVPESKLGKMSGRGVVVLDLETTGLDSRQHAILEIAIRQENGRMWHTFIKPDLDSLQKADPNALELCGYDPEKWRAAPSIEDVLPEIEKIIEWKVLVAHNISFDWGFLEAAFRKQNRTPPFCWKVDTLSLAYAQLAPKGIDRLNLKECCEFVGIPFSENRAHRADYDAEATWELFKRLTETENS